MNGRTVFMAKSTRSGTLPMWLEACWLKTDEEIATCPTPNTTSGVLRATTNQELLSRINGDGRGYWFEVAAPHESVRQRRWLPTVGLVGASFPGYQGQKASATMGQLRQVCGEVYCRTLFGWRQSLVGSPRSSSMSGGVRSGCSAHKCCSCPHAGQFIK